MAPAQCFPSVKSGFLTVLVAFSLFSTTRTLRTALDTSGNGGCRCVLDEVNDPCDSETPLTNGDLAGRQSSSRRHRMVS